MRRRRRGQEVIELGRCDAVGRCEGDFGLNRLRLKLGLVGLNRSRLFDIRARTRELLAVYPIIPFGSITVFTSRREGHTSQVHLLNKAFSERISQLSNGAITISPGQDHHISEGRRPCSSLPLPLPLPVSTVSLLTSTLKPGDPSHNLRLRISRT